MQKSNLCPINVQLNTDRTQTVSEQGHVCCVFAFQQKNKKTKQNVLNGVRELAL